jgi:hypothetical protein
VNRRDFLFLRRTPRGRTLELSCRALYMRTLNAEAPTTSAENTVYGHEPWMGEPPADFHRLVDDDWLREIETELRNVDVLKLLDEEWLKPTGISDQLEPLITAFCTRGGRVEYGKS